MMTLSEEIQESYLEQLLKYGESGLTQGIINISLSNLELNARPEYRLLDQSQEFLKLFRRTGEENYLTLSKVLRRAAHIIYREYLKQNKGKLDLKRFLNIV